MTPKQFDRVWIFASLVVVAICAAVIWLCPQGGLP